MTAAARKLKPEAFEGLQLSIRCGTFAGALRRAAEIAEKKLNIPILNHVRLTAADGTLTVRACDTNRDLAVTVEADVAEPGDLCLPAQALRSLIDGWWSGNQVAIKAEDGRCTVSSGRSRYKLASLPAAEFPMLDGAGADAVSFDLAGSILTDALARVSWAMSTDTTRHYLCGVYVHTKGDKLLFVATDGKALAHVELPRHENMPDLCGVIMPDTVLSILSKIAETESVRLAIDQHKLSAVAGNVQFVTKLVDGTYPDYPRVMPTASPDRAVTVDRAAMMSAFKRLDALADDSSVVKVCAAEHGLTIINWRSQLGEGTEDIEAEISGDISFVASRRWLVPALQSFKGEHVFFEQGSIGDPIRLTGSADAGLTVIVMPAME